MISRKKVQRFMRAMGIEGLAPGPRTSVPKKGHKVYPYLLRGIEITKPNQVWAVTSRMFQCPRATSI